MPVLVNFLKHNLRRSLIFYVIIKVWVIFRCYACSSTDNFLSSVPVSDWIIFCCGNLILHQKRKWKWYKHKFFVEKQQKIVTFFTLNLAHGPWCNMLQTLEMRRKYRWKEIVSGTHSVIALNIEAQFFSRLSLYDKTFTSQ